MKTFVLLIAMVSILLLGAVFYYGFQLYFEVMDAIINPMCPETICYQARSYPLFEQAVEKIGGRVYTEDYKCLHFSKDLVGELERGKVKSSIAISKDRKHAWVVVWIEATTGDFIPPNRNLEILELRDKDMNVICK